MTELNEIVPLIDAEWDQESEKICEDREWLVKKACGRITEMAKIHISKYNENLKEEANENEEIVEFNWVNVRKDLKNFTKFNQKGEFEGDKSPLKYNFDEIFDGGFSKQKSIIDRQRFRDAGVINPFVLDVKRKIANKCIKVWDVSDKKKSDKIVWKITVFIHEIKKRSKKD